MQVHVKRSEWDRLPFREDVTGQFEPNGRYRSHHDAGAIHLFKGTPEREVWWTFGVDIEDDTEWANR